VIFHANEAKIDSFFVSFKNLQFLKLENIAIEFSQTRQKPITTNKENFTVKNEIGRHLEPF
jgi:hypothetical protein